MAMKKNKNRNHSTTLRNNIIFKGDNRGSRLYEVGGGYIGTICLVSPEKVAAMPSEEFKAMLVRHGIA